MKSWGFRHYANSTKRRRKTNLIRKRAKGNVAGNKVVTASDTLILMKRFCKFCYKEGITGDFTDFTPFFYYAQKYLKNYYTLNRIRNRMIWLKKKYLSLRKNVGNPNFSFKTKYESSIYKWGNVAWNEHIDDVLPMIDLVKTPQKKKDNEQCSEKKDEEEIKERDHQLISYGSDSEEIRERERDHKHISYVSDYESEKKEIAENDDQLIICVSESECEKKETGIKDDQHIIYVSDSESTEEKVNKFEYQMEKNKFKKECDSEWLTTFKYELAKRLQEFQESYSWELK